MHAPADLRGHRRAVCRGAAHNPGRLHSGSRTKVSGERLAAMSLLQRSSQVASPSGCFQCSRCRSWTSYGDFVPEFVCDRCWRPHSRHFVSTVPRKPESADSGLGMVETPGPLPRASIAIRTSATRLWNIRKAGPIPFPSPSSSGVSGQRAGSGSLDCGHPGAPIFREMPVVRAKWRSAVLTPLRDKNWFPEGLSPGFGGVGCGSLGPSILHNSTPS